MKNKLRAVLICLFLTIGRLIGQSYTVEMDSILDHLEWFNQSFYENISVQLNKEVYRPNDAIWFKANLRGYSGSTSNSETLYVQLIDEKNSLLQINRFKIVNSQASGQIFLGDVPSNKIYYLVFATQKSKINQNPLIRLIQVRDFNPESSFDYSTLDFSQEENNSRGSISIHRDTLKFLYNVKKDPLNVILKLDGEPIWAEERNIPGLRSIIIPTSKLKTGEITYGLFSNHGILEQGSIHINLCNSKVKVKRNKEITDINKVGISIQVKAENSSLTGKLAASIYLKELNPTLKETSIHAVSKPLGVTPHHIEKFNLIDPYKIYGKVEPDKKRKSINGWAMNDSGTSYYETPVDEGGNFIIEITEKKETYVVGASDDKGNFQKIILKDSIHFLYPLPTREVSKINDTTLISKRSAIREKEDAISFTKYLDNQILPEIVVRGKSLKSLEAVERKKFNQTQLFSSFDNVGRQELSGDRLIGASAVDLETLIKRFGFIRTALTSDGLFAYNTSRGRGSFTGGAWPLLFVVNGIRRGWDMNQLFDILPMNIKSIRLTRSTTAALQFGLDARGGVVIIDTKDATDIPLREVEESKLESVSYYSEEIEFVPNGSIESCFFWDSNLPVTNGSADITFEKPGLLGTYVLAISGYDNNGCYINKHVTLQSDLLR